MTDKQKIKRWKDMGLDRKQIEWFKSLFCGEENEKRTERLLEKWNNNLFVKVAMCQTNI
jgi:hypothetical protein